MDHCHQIKKNVKMQTLKMSPVDMQEAEKVLCRGEHSFVCVIPAGVLAATVPAWCHRGRGLQGHSRLLHCLTDGEEGD